MIKKVLKNIDYLILIIIVGIFLIGVFSLKSSGNGAGGNVELFGKQITWFCVGMVIAVLIAFIDYRNIKKFAPVLYGMTLVLLVFVLRSNPTNGATSWFKVGPLSLQPSEFFKIALILTIALFIEYANQKDGINKIKNVFIAIALLLIPILLIVKQPDYGTALVVIAIWAFMIFAGGIYFRYIAVAVAIAVVSIPLVYTHLLPEHAKKRIEVFLNPMSDPQGAGYNIIQSELAVGSRANIWNGFI